MGLEYQLIAATKAVTEAGRIILGRCHSGDFGIEYKTDGSPATKADKEAEAKIRDILLDAFPGYSFIGEESKPVNGNNGFRWYCDPVDGTWCMLNGEKTASTSLALSENGKTVLAVVYNPFTGEMFTGADGIQTMLNGEPIPRFNKTNPREAVYNFQISAKRKGIVFELYDLLEQRAIAKLVSRGGSIAYSLAQVAEGSHSCYIAASIKPADEWDVAGGIYLVKSVGGEVSQLDGGRVLIASTNPEIHRKTLDLLAQNNSGKRD